VHLRSKAFDRTILNICKKDLLLAVQKTIWETEGVTYLLHIDAVACATEDQTCSHCLCKPSSLVKRDVSRLQNVGKVCDLLDLKSPPDLPLGNLQSDHTLCPPRMELQFC
jgi:hypothetical protein